MNGLPLDLWIRYRTALNHGGSIFWRSVRKNLHWILNGLSWHIGNGRQVRIGLDPFAGITDESYRLPEQLVIKLQSRGYGRLANIRCASGSSLHYWLSSRDLGLSSLEVVYWNRYLDILHRHGIRLTNNDDVLVWDGAPDGNITAKSLYTHLIMDHTYPKEVGWKHSIWKWNIAPKIKFFWWLVLHHSILTWDNLVKKGFSGPGMCALCTDNSEDINHLFVFCRYTKYIWSYLVHTFNFAWAWDDLPVCENFDNWTRMQPKKLHFPILVCWIIWKARNGIIFDHIRRSARSIIYHITQLYGLYPDKEIMKKRQLQTTTLQEIHTQHFGTFDGAAQCGNCSGGGTLTLLDGRIIHFKVGLGAGTNSRVELLSLWALLWLAKRLNCDEIQVLGDSQAIID